VTRVCSTGIPRRRRARRFRSNVARGRTRCVLRALGPAKVIDHRNRIDVVLIGRGREPLIMPTGPPGSAAQRIRFTCSRRTTVCSHAIGLSANTASQIAGTGTESSNPSDLVGPGMGLDSEVSITAHLPET